MEAQNVVVRSKSGNLSLSSNKQEMIDWEIAYHIWELQQDFESGISEECDFDADETHFRIDTHVGRTLSIDEFVKYADVVSGSDGMTMMLMLGRCTHSTITTPIMVFQNPTCNYPIKGISDSVPGVIFIEHNRKYGWIRM